MYLAIVFHPFTLVQCIPFVKEAGAFMRPGSLKAATARPKRDYKSRRRVINKICEFRWDFLHKVIFMSVIFTIRYFKTEI